MSKIAVVVPSIRPESLITFLGKWEKLFAKHEIMLVIVFDGENPRVEYFQYRNPQKGINMGGNCLDFMGKDKDLIFNLNDGVRNLGFAYIATYMPEIETIITLDDDTEPCGDTIQDHLDALNQKVPVSWISTTNEYTRGFPYGIREEAEVVLSHGVWEGVPDYDAPTQLVTKPHEVYFNNGAIPKGIFYPMCGMNIAFKRKMLPYMYFAPMGHKVGLDRFADIWCGINSKKEIDKRGWAVVTGQATVLHKRASNVFANLKKEAPGLELNETYWQGDISGNPKYFKLYQDSYKRWQKFVKMNDMQKRGDCK